jgi:SnoaL-like domain
MDGTVVEQWVERYERVWRTPGTDGLADLFQPDATYLPSPWATPITGLDELAEFWDAERDGAEEDFSMSSEVVAVEGETAVVRVSVEYGVPDGGRWRDLWVIRLAPDGRCYSFEEWPFAPSETDGH